MLIGVGEDSHAFVFHPKIALRRLYSKMVGIPILTFKGTQAYQSMQPARKPHQPSRSDSLDIDGEAFGPMPIWHEKLSG